jgi:hypothetical protein
MLPFLRLAKAQNPLPKFLQLIISPFLSYYLLIAQKRRHFSGKVPPLLFCVNGNADYADWAVKER